MTIALGILASDGIVIAADAQVTTSGLSHKRDQGKVTMSTRRSDPTAGPDYFAGIVVSGAGSLSCMEHLRQGISKAFRESPSLLSVPETKAELEKQVLDFHEVHFTPHCAGMADVFMLVGAFDATQKALWVTDRSFVNEVSAFAAVGIGEAHASSLMGKLYAPMDTMGAILLSAFVVSEVKDAVEGCGNDTDIFAIGPTKSCWVSRAHTRALTEIFRRYSRVEAHRLHELFSGHIGWSDGSTDSTRTEAESLRDQIQRVAAAIEYVPEWAKAPQPSNPSNSESSQT